MTKLLTDMHTHSTFSHDGRSSLLEMIDRAREQGLCFYGVSEHLDYDLFFSTFNEKYKGYEPEEYFHKARHLQEDYQGVINVLIGYEFGYIDDEKIKKMYQDVVEKYAPDFVINSIHLCNGEDYYFKNVYYKEKNGEKALRNKDEVYEEYLSAVRRSLDVNYHYDIVGHLGYATRYAPYEDKRIDVEKHKALLVDILQTIIKKDKILEVNSSNKGGLGEFLPQRDIIELYFALGGRQISYGSDAHDVGRVADKRAEVMQTLKEIGFTYVVVPCKKEYIKIEI